MNSPEIHLIRLPLLIFLLCAVATQTVAEASGADLVTVRLFDGYEVRGRVDAATDAERLAIRRGEPGLEITVSYDWASITEVIRGDETLPAAEFRSLADELKTAPEEDFFQKTGDTRPAPLPDDAAATGGRPDLDFGPLQTIRVEARLANWDRDVTPDGIELRLLAMDACERLVPVSGSLDVRLFGQRLDRHRPARKFPQLHRWTRRVETADFGRYGGVFRLPFRGSFRPHRDRDIGNNALVHVRLSVPGQGLFEDSDAWVQLRVPSRFRDQLEFGTRRRFLPIEQADR